MEAGQALGAARAGMTPMFTSVRPMRARSEARRMSHASAISKPPPRQKPLIAAMTGMRHFSMRVFRRLPSMPPWYEPRRPSGSRPRCRHRRRSLAVAAGQHDDADLGILLVRVEQVVQVVHDVLIDAFSFSGRFSVMMPTPSRFSAKVAFSSRSAIMKLPFFNLRDATLASLSHAFVPGSRSDKLDTRCSISSRLRIFPISLRGMSCTIS